MATKHLNTCECSTRPAVCIAEIIFGEKIYFLEFSPECSLNELIRRAILGLASSLHAPYELVSEKMIDLKEYKDFVFYIEDYSGRKISLQGREKEFQAILRYFSYKLILHIYLFNKAGE
ncbi:hypothetical protein NECID01_1276 [Nematocida sp. AWRm77]|nr:hypothetical protein NECID01_1276 [Nematocida sp. AWRm77]